jgi:hypothetical protein
VQQKVNIVVVPGSPTGVRPDEAEVLPVDGTEVPFKPVVTLTDTVISLASGDADADGFADLAVDLDNGSYVPRGEHATHGDVTSHPVVDVVYGSSAGLGQGRATQMWDRESKGVPGSDIGTRSSASAFGRFNRDRYDDLAIAIPEERGVVVILGGANGLRSAGAEFVDLPGKLVDSKTLVTTADFDADHDDELVVSAANQKKMQRVDVLQGTRHGLTARHAQVWTQSVPGFPRRHLFQDNPRWDTLGSALRAGYFGRGAGEDLLISDDADAHSAGSVTELFGSSRRGLTIRYAARITEATKGVPGAPSTEHQTADRFGA